MKIQNNSTKKLSLNSKHQPQHWNYEFELIKCEQFESRANVSLLLKYV